MAKKMLFSLIMVLLSVSAVFAGEKINGRWLSNFETPDGQEMEIVFTFAVKGDTLTGTVAGPLGELPLTNGKVKGDEFSFDVEAEFGTIRHECRIKDDIITMKIIGEYGESPEFTLRRAPKE